MVEGAARLHLGRPSGPPPPPPLLIDHLKDCGHELETASQFVACCERDGWDEDQLWEPMDEFA